MYVRRPPEPEPAGTFIKRPTHGILARRLFDHDGSVSSKALIQAGTSDHYFLQGVYAGASDPEMLTDLSTILAMIDTFGAVEVVITR